MYINLSQPLGGRLAILALLCLPPPLEALVAALKYCLGEIRCLSEGNIMNDLSDFLSCVGVDRPF